MSEQTTAFHRNNTEVSVDFPPRVWTPTERWCCFYCFKQAIRKTPTKQARSWQINAIRARLRKVGATIKKTRRRIYYRLSRAFVYRDLPGQLIA